MRLSRFSPAIAPAFGAGRKSPQAIPPLTVLRHEETLQFNVPHHFQVFATDTGKLVGRVDFQEGPVKEHGLNGVRDVDVLQMLILRMQGFQTSPFACKETAVALRHLELALKQLNQRYAKRVARGVFGTNQQ